MMSSEAWDAVRLSLEVALMATFGALPFALLIAFVLERLRFPGQGILDALVLAPLVMPPVVVGYLLLIGFGVHGLMGRFFNHAFGMRFVFTEKACVIAAAVMAFPLIVRSIRLSLAAVDPNLEQAARTLGCGPFRTLRTVTLPLIRPGILAGLVVGFARALGEFGATITFASNIEGVTRTLPLAIYTATQTINDEGLALRLVLVSVLLSAFALAISTGFERILRPKSAR